MLGSFSKNCILNSLWGGGGVWPGAISSQIRNLPPSSLGIPCETLNHRAYNHVSSAWWTLIWVNGLHTGQKAKHVIILTWKDDMAIATIPLSHRYLPPTINIAKPMTGATKGLGKLRRERMSTTLWPAINN